jgi:hypothetical protein
MLGGARSNRTVTGIRACYEEGLHRKPDLAGRVAIRFVIQTDGSVREVSPNCIGLPDPTVVRCIVERFRKIQFPSPSGGPLAVLYPIIFTTAK